MQRYIHLFIVVEEKDTICRLVKGFDLSFETPEAAPCLGSCADLSVLPGWRWGVSSVSWLALLQGHCSFCQSAPQTKSPPAGKGLPGAGLTSSPVSVVGCAVLMCPASPFACHLFHPVCSGSSLHVEVIFCDAVSSIAQTSSTTIILSLLPFSFKLQWLNCMLIHFSFPFFPLLLLLSLFLCFSFPSLSFFSVPFLSLSPFTALWRSCFFLGLHSIQLLKLDAGSYGL